MLYCDPFQVLLDSSLTAAVWVYGCIGFVCAICAVFLPIETKGRELPVSKLSFLSTSPLAM